MNFYKVVQVLRGCFVSAVAPSGKFRMRYLIGEDTLAPLGAPLMGFRSLSDAKDFIGDNRRFYILRGEGEEVEGPPRVMDLTWGSMVDCSEKSIREFWDKFWEGGGVPLGCLSLSAPTQEVPRGTVFLGWFRPQEREEI